ncbi:thiamine pyrophosphate-binding protein [Cellulosilyticum ruminicola]|uniref:thiamine pyrophosphate-binding protein n=1 Tax=Cellulosilyticum ruminicola TaxID=425254 RepID=UPI0006CFE1CD|nr:thiamine pyrophosphate-binding protein [Cellulosilyticum ruminicola]
MSEYEVTGGELVIKELVNLGITDIFALVGNQVSPILVNAQQYGLNVVSTRHEQGAVHMADGWAQVKRQTGVAVVSGGPGFTNTITGIMKAYYARTPLLVITGAVVTASKEQGVLQDVDQLATISKYTKWSKTVPTTERIPEYISRAIQMANTGRKGPVVLEIPIHILKRTINISDLVMPNDFANRGVMQATNEQVLQLLKLVQESKRPVAIIGDEAYYSYAKEEVIEFVYQLGIPTYTINKARGIIADTNPVCMGAGRVIEGGPQLLTYKKADLILAIGVNVDYQMGQFSPLYFNPECKFVCMNEVEEEYAITGANVDFAVLGNIKANLALANRIIDAHEMTFDYEGWLAEVQLSRKMFFQNLAKEKNVDVEGHLNAFKTLQFLNQYMAEDTILVIDGSNAMFWATLMLNCITEGQLIIGPDGQYGPMGTGVALAVGAKVANPDKNVILYTGDGSFGFNLIELDTLRRTGLTMKIFVHNDSTWGLCKSTQKLLYDHLGATDIQDVRYDLIVEALGGQGFTIDNQEDFESKVAENYTNQVTSCFNLIMDEDDYSPGTTCFNESLSRQK